MLKTRRFLLFAALLLLIAGLIAITYTAHMAAEQEVLNLSPEQIQQMREQAKQGDASTQFNLGERYYKGEGIAQDYAEAAKWFRRAAEQGDASAQNNLGWRYRIGEGVSQSHKEAYIWFSVAAANGIDAHADRMNISFADTQRG